MVLCDVQYTYTKKNYSTSKIRLKSKMRWDKQIFQKHSINGALYCAFVTDVSVTNCLKYNQHETHNFEPLYL